MFFCFVFSLYWLAWYIFSYLKFYSSRDFSLSSFRYVGVVLDLKLQFGAGTKMAAKCTDWLLKGTLSFIIYICSYQSHDQTGLQNMVRCYACCSLSIYSKSYKNLHLSVGEAHKSVAVMTHDRSMYLMIMEANCVAERLVPEPVLGMSWCCHSSYHQYTEE